MGRGAAQGGRGRRPGSWRPFPFITPCAPSVHLAEVSFGLCNAGGGCSGLLVSLLFWALSSLQDRRGRGLVPRLGGGARSRAVPGPRDGAEGGAPGSGPRRRALAVPPIAMVAGLILLLSSFIARGQILPHVTVAPGYSLPCAWLALLHFTDLASFLTSSAAFAFPGGVASSSGHERS